jgi:nucleolin
MFSALRHQLHSSFAKPFSRNVVLQQAKWMQSSFSLLPRALNYSSESSSPAVQQPPVAEDRNRMVYVANIPFRIMEAELAKMFENEQLNPTSIRYLTDRSTGKFRGIGFVQFETEEQAARAVGMDGFEVMGRNLRIQKSINTMTPVGGRRSPPSNSCFVGNLPFTTEESEVRSLFSKFGSIMEIRLPMDHTKGVHKG